jgi:pimeloyl-ACP methyl ester carboxylesterase
MQEIELSAGVVEYEDSGGSGPVVVLIGGLMDASLWRHVVSDLSPDYRCVVPIPPLGSHRRPMRRDADLSLQGIARLEADFLEAVDLHNVTLVGNDSGAFLLAAGEHPERVARLVITSCEAFENFPPGTAGRLLCYLAELPGGVNLLMQPLRIRSLRRLPFASGGMTKRPVPNSVMDAWLKPLQSDRQIRRDLAKYLRSAKAGQMIGPCERLSSFARPTLIVWGADDRMMPPEHGQRFAELIRDAQLVEVADCRTLIPEDQPAELARHIRAFVREAPRVGG